MIPWVLAYLCIGFVLLVILFSVLGPQAMWYRLNDCDPYEPSFSFLKTTTVERVRRDDDHFGAWFCVLMTLFAWPVLIVFLSVLGLIWLLVYCAKRLAMLVSKEKMENNNE